MSYEWKLCGGRKPQIFQLFLFGIELLQQWAEREMRNFGNLPPPRMILDWDLSEERVLHSWIYLLRIELLLCWSRREMGSSGSWLKCYRLIFFLDKFSRFSWVNVSPFAVSSLRIFRDLKWFFKKIFFTSYGCFTGERIHEPIHDTIPEVSTCP